MPGAKEQQKRRWRPGTKALREVRNYQKTFDFLIPKPPFQRLWKEICDDIDPSKRLRWQATAISALQESSESLLFGVFDIINFAAIHTNRVTIKPKDLHLVQAILKAGRVHGDKWFDPESGKCGRLIEGIQGVRKLGVTR
ncbi:histone H3 [Colletotrichum truncatum]|uniref:Histone H3 n=2 Tax=Colletotrichum truncatum TaxID=5467 RepID=A0ACC3ZC30_COLTU